ncbi:MAG: ribosome assembly factor SBDS [Candidatus Nanoarchaeia archaeon]|nr:ribosome assembly factor SBDS [Candidatus Haiyanarchaeum thermophilum]MCW1303018.1 ribosome assembly factor SBDS [Candidatus Haiyanarchaeum thermophilum]MCW1303696.1 ribosome assembly factor SBDS [Candidatus Haiyanarchaeum thermophilum]MCW1306376.1 ribosome assembly factor SBDS [Candidatus Haiyanarchaeum thermophilum]MCW1307114.1 ribosome assembly factor SBDS [Candidatus Haiyanarchaeum thermophilum]
MGGEKAVIARLRKGSKNFEILVECDKAMEFRKDPSKVDIREILVVPEIFKDARKGDRAGGLKEEFGTDDVFEIAKRIVLEGEVQLTAEYKKKLEEEKRRRIISLIAMNAIDARTEKPIPEKRIEIALQEAKVHIDPFKEPEEQVKEVVEKLRQIIPLKFEEVRIKSIIPPQYAGKAYGQIQKLGEVEKMEWLNDGSLLSIIKVPAGMQVEVINKLNKLSSNNAHVEVIR